MSIDQEHIDANYPLCIAAGDCIFTGNSRFCYIIGGWTAIVILGAGMLMLPFGIGLLERNYEKR